MTLQNTILTGPVAGQSLTENYKNERYNRPSDITDPNDAIRFHIDNLSEEKPVVNTIKILELGMPIKPLTETILTTAVMEGVHSLDVSLTIAPVIYDYIKTIADKAGVNYKTGLEDDEEDEAINEKDFEDSMIAKALNESDDDYIDDDMDATNIEELENIDRTRELNPGFDDLPLMFDEDKNNLEPDPNYKRPKDRGPDYPFPLGSDDNPIMASKGLMSRRTV